MLKPVIVATSDKVYQVVERGLSFCVNILHTRLKNMQNLTHNYAVVQSLLQKLFENVALKTGEPKLKNTLYSQTVNICMHPVVG